MSCEGCIQTAKGKQMEYDRIKTEAKKYAIENEKVVAIFQEGLNWQFIVAEKAAGLVVREYVSK